MKRSLFIISLSLLLLIHTKGSYTLSSNSTVFPNSGKPLFITQPSSSAFELIINPYLFKVEKCTNTKLTYTTDIMQNGQMTITQLREFLQSFNQKISDREANLFAQYYIEECRMEGVNHDIAFSQMCLETGYLKFGGNVHVKQNNFCGLGVTGPGVIGNSFKTIRMGIRAHVQHLKAYASRLNLNNELIDQRFFLVSRGSAPTVDKLTGKWATDPDYDKKIRYILSRMYKDV